MTTTADRVWRKCSSCKNPIELGSRYYVCSVSTCNGQRTGYVFCGVPCFERHLPTARHKDAGAIEKQAPREAEPQASSAITESRPPARVFASQPKSVPQEVLVIASRLKDYIDARSGFSTSAGVMDVLSDHLRIVCDRAIENARSDGRKTVMDRDFQFLKKG
jgi:hypothetical protein